jgi:hypothetical protein
MAETIDMVLSKNASGLYQSGVAPLTAVYHGAIVDIPGTGFGDRPTFGFAGGKFGRIERHSGGVDAVNSGGFFLSYERPKEVVTDPQRGKVWYSNVWDGSNETADNGTIAFDIGSPMPSGSKIFTHTVAKLECDATYFQWKFHRQEATYNIVDGGPEWYNMYWKKDIGRYFGLRHKVNAADGGTVHSYYGNASNQAIRMDGAPEWFSQNYYNVVGSENTNDGSNYGEATSQIGTTQLYDVPTANHFDVGVTARPRWVVLQNYLGNYNEGVPTVGRVWVDDFYVQWAEPGKELIRVVMSSSPAYASRTDDEIQQPSFGWNNSNAQIVINAGGLTAGPKYLHVVSGKNTVLQTIPVVLVG